MAIQYANELTGDSDSQKKFIRKMRTKQQITETV